MPALRRSALGSLLLAAAALPVWAQQADAPSLSRQQREALQTLVRAVDTTTTAPLPDGDWPLHVLRASDGSHYVAFSIHRPEGVQLGRPFILYVRLASRRADAATQPERSAVAEWLTGQSPTPALPQRGLAFGEMPTYGAGAVATRGPGAGTQNLQLLELEQRRAREKREEQERARKAALEGTGATRTPRPLLPFEDFDLRAEAVADSGGAPVIRRSLTAGPGDYELTLAWIDMKGGTPIGAAHVIRRPLSLAPASTTTFGLSSVIVADSVTIRESPVAATEQTARPYSIGSTEITPARDHILGADERLALVVQVFNPRALPNGKPDVAVSFRVLRQQGAREDPVGTLTPQLYNELTLPLDFDVTKGHPIFAAVAVPLKTFKRGDYRLEVAAHDRAAGVGAMTDVLFTVAGTPASLLREAPPLVPAFHAARESLPPTVGIMLGAIRASEGNDRDAIVQWDTAVANGADSAIVWPLIIDAHLRQGDTTRAIELARRGLEAAPGHARFTRQLATAYLMNKQSEQAWHWLDAHLSRHSDDVEAQWLALHTLFAEFVEGTGRGATDRGRAQIGELAARYAAANGTHATLARDWAAAVR
jgi:hypothetical protein